MKDMTKGSPAGLLLGFSLPLMLGNLFQQLYTFVDALIVGRRVSVYALDALGATEWLTFIMFGVISGLMQGCAIVISRHFGEKQYDLLQKSIFGTYVIAGIGALLLTVVGQMAIYPSLKWLRTPAEILEIAHAYLKILYAGIPVTFFYNLYAAILRAFGDSKKPLHAMLIASLGNIVLDLIFVVNLNMGIAGTAWGTLISQGIAGVYCAAAVYKLDLCRIEKRNRHLEQGILREQLQMGVPMGLQNMITAAGGLVVQAVVNGCGILFITGYVAANKLYVLLEIAASSYAQGMLTYTAQNRGTGDKKRMKDGLAAALTIGVVTSLAMSLIMFLAGKDIIGLFITEEAIDSGAAVEIGYRFLKLLAVFFSLLYCLYIIRAYIQGFGNSVIPMASSFVQVVMRVGCALLLIRLIGNTGIFWGEVMAWTGADIFLVVFLVGNWKRMIC